MPPSDLAIIGAGPAGLSAAVLAVELGLAVTLLDEQPEPGGQIYRRIGSVTRHRPGLLPVLGPDYRRGQDLLTAFQRAIATSAGRLDYCDRAMVWNRDADGTLSFTRNGAVGQIRPAALLLATGAMERPLPAPGFTLPGVMGAGALQILLKTSGLVPEGRIVLLGGGPLLLLLATQYLRAGVKIAAIVETTRRDPRGALAALPQVFYADRAFHAGGYLAKGAAMLMALRRGRIPVYRNAEGIRAIGGDRVEAVSFTQGRRRIDLAADLLGVHEGVVPQSQLARAIGCGHRWDAMQFCFRPVLGPWGRSDQAGIWIAGDAGGIGGARAAEHQARIAVLDIAVRLGRLGAAEAERLAAPDRRSLARHLAIRPLLDRLYMPGLAAAPAPDETILCRCEEVRAGEIRAAVRDGCRGPNQVKAFLRCGMGPCQGRMCGLPVSQTIAQATGVTPAETGHYRIRPPILPVSLGDIARFSEGDAAAKPPSFNQSHKMEETS